MLNFYFEFLQTYYFLNSLVFCAFLLIVYLVLTDDRFLFNSKNWFLFLLILLFIISIYIFKVPYEIIKDLFWFSLTLNISFIIHTLILDRLFHWSWKNHYEYLGFIISRISFTLSLSFIIYFIWELRCFLLFYFNINGCLDHYYSFNENKDKFLTKYIFFYNNYIKSNLLLNFIFNLVYYIIDYSCTWIRIICINFSIIFHNYSLLLLGKEIIWNIKEQKEEFNMNIIFEYLIKFSILIIIIFIITIIIGPPRLYIIWFLQVLIKCYNIWLLELYIMCNKFGLYDDYKEFYNLTFLENLKQTYKFFINFQFFFNYYKIKEKELEEIYEKPYHPFFMFGLCKFNFYRAAISYNFIWNYPNLDNPIYKYISWKDIALAYIYDTRKFVVNKKYLEFCKKNKEEIDFEDFIKEEIRDKIWQIIEALYWIRLINKNENHLSVLIPDLTISNDELELAKDLLNKFY